MIQINVNGQPHELADGATIVDLLRQLEVVEPHVAVEVNLELVPRAKHAATELCDGDRLEVVTLVGGG
jgi:sulfur carrier protein